jgi:hypothetical protein
MARTGACGCLVNSSAASSRPAVASSGRVLPSRPSLVFNFANCGVERRLIAAIVLGESPVQVAILESERCGSSVRMRSAAAVRSDRLRPIFRINDTRHQRIARKMAIGATVVRGRIDTVFADPDGGATAVDWKTGSSNVGPRRRRRIDCNAEPCVRN